MREKLEFSESKQCCAEHIKMPFLLCGQGAIDWGALSRSLSSSPPPCAERSFSLFNFHLTILAARSILDNVC